jgi:hypothetical protein
VRELTFADGSVYRGAMRGRNLHGKGELIAKAFTYEGEMRLGQPAGRGVFWFVDGTRFEGVFEDGLARARGGRSSNRTGHAPRPQSSTAKPSSSTSGPGRIC